MSGRSSHEFIKRKCENLCCKLPDGYSSNELDIDTKVNIIRTRTRASCCFSVPIDICNFYGDPGCGTPGDTTPNDTFFVTHPDHPSATLTPLPPGSLNDGAVFRIESFITTNKGYFRNGLLGGDTQDGNSQEHVEDQFDVVILRRDAMASSGLILNNPIYIVDTPMETLNSSFALGSLDFVFKQIFATFDGLLLPVQVNATMGASHGFLSLTNPNEFEFGTPNVIQIIWPENLDWSIQFVGPNNKRYVYSAVSRKNHPSGVTQCTVTETDLNVTPNTTVQLDTFTCSQAWAIPCDPLEYIKTRHSFDLSFPGITGCTGITEGVVCVDSIKIEGVSTVLRKDCLCDEFFNDFGIGSTGLAGVTGPFANGNVIVNLLNKAFGHSKITKGWKAINDIQYGYIRLVHPDNILFFDIVLTKNFFKNGTPCTQCTEKIIFKQGGQTVYIKPNEDFELISTTNNTEIMNGVSWSSESDMLGCFLLDVE